ncbi:DNA polymerase III subunit beta [Candidatus Saccharibacteria bacterium]|nr:DNA polymerase III subunit beta [Candidatus Saccharibacteria bacterium]
MELSVTQENLARALSAVGRVASSKAGLPILANILLRTEGNRLLVAATNLEMASTYHIGAKVVKQGSITLPARLVSEFVSNLPKGTIEMSTKGAHITLKSGTYSSVINGVDAEDFPELPSIDEDESVRYTIVASQFKQAVSQTIITSSADATRPVLTGVYWHSVDGWLCLAATDGYRLAERKLVETKSTIAAIVPTSSLQEVLRTLSDNIDEVEVLFDDSQVRFRVGEAEITSRLIDGNYPDYRQLVPKESETVVTIPTDDFARIVKIAGLFARESGGSITLTANADTQDLSIHSIASELGENTSSASATVSHEGQVTLNSRYLSEALTVLDGNKITFRFSGKLSPTVLSVDEKNSNYFHIIMPLKS